MIHFEIKSIGNYDPSRNLLYCFKVYYKDKLLQPLTGTASGFCCYQDDGSKARCEWQLDLKEAEKSIENLPVSPLTVKCYVVDNTSRKYDISEESFLGSCRIDMSRLFPNETSERSKISLSGPDRTSQDTSTKMPCIEYLLRWDKCENAKEVDYEDTKENTSKLQALSESLESYVRTACRSMTPVDNNINQPEIMSSISTLISLKFNLRDAFDRGTDFEDTLDDVHIYLNKLVCGEDNVLAADVKVSNNLQNAKQCFELDYKEEAKDFYLLNLTETNNSSDCLLDYAVYNLQVQDPSKSYECLIVNTNERDFMAQFLKSYIYFLHKKIDECQKTLLAIVGRCRNFLEAWMALFFLHFELNGCNENEYLRNAVTSLKCGYFCSHLHKKPSSNYEQDVYNLAISNFIEWGCLRFAELGLSWTASNTNCKSFKFLYYSALILYRKQKYEQCLEALENVRTNNYSQIFELSTLKCLCSLKVSRKDSVKYVNKAIRSYRLIKPMECSCRQLELIYLKFGNYLIDNKKGKTAKYYLNKCCRESISYCSLLGLGKVAFEENDFVLAENCFKLLHKMNPITWTPLVYLSLLYKKTNRLLASEICLQNIKKLKITEERLKSEVRKIESH